MHKIHYPKISDTPKCSPNETFWYCVTIIFRRKILILPPPPLIQKLFRYRTFSETHIRRVPLRKFSVLRDEKFRENRDTLPPMHENFRYQNSFETQKGSPTKFIGTVRQKFFKGV